MSGYTTILSSGCNEKNLSLQVLRACPSQSGRGPAIPVNNVSLLPLLVNLSRANHFFSYYISPNNMMMWKPHPLYCSGSLAAPEIPQLPCQHMCMRAISLDRSTDPPPLQRTTDRDLYLTLYVDSCA